MLFTATPFLLLVALGADSCSGEVTRGTLRHNFTLSAFNTSLPNANHTGAPLVLGSNGAGGPLSFWVTSTYASFPEDEFPSLGLVDNTLRAYGTDGSWTTNATDATIGAVLGWVSTTVAYPAAPEVYSVVQVLPYELPLLAAHGIYNQWSLCPFPYPGVTDPQTNLVFNVSAINPALHFNTAACYNVVIKVLPIHKAHKA